jgi:GPH family glycoside/pentoside/hexuronide:cation symporter
MKFKPFLKLCGATFLVFNGFMLIAFVSVLRDHLLRFLVVIRSKARSGQAIRAPSAPCRRSVSSSSSPGWAPRSANGKRSTSAPVSRWPAMRLNGSATTPEIPWFTSSACTVDGIRAGWSVHADAGNDRRCRRRGTKLQTHERREGMYGSIFWWVVKLGMAAALARRWLLVECHRVRRLPWKGNQAEQTIFLMRLFDAFVPAIASGIAIWIIATFSITEETAYKVRQQLEQRRGPAPNPVPPELPAGTPVTARRGRRKHSSLSVLHTPRPRSP